MRENNKASAKYATAKIAVWWHINDCPVPDGYDARRVRPSIERALKNLGYSAPVSITAYGYLKHTPDHVLRGLISTGIALQQTICESTCFAMFSDLVEWRRDNPSPATMMLISNQVDGVFSWPLCRLQQVENYNLVVAYANDVYSNIRSSVLVTSAEWIWERLLEETREEVLEEKCSETGESTSMLYCRSCRIDGESLENFRKHLSSEEHELTEYFKKRSKQRPYTADEEELEQNIPKRKRSRKASPKLTGFRLLRNHLHIRAYRVSRLKVWRDPLVHYIATRDLEGLQHINIEDEEAAIAAAVERQLERKAHERSNK